MQRFGTLPLRKAAHFIVSSSSSCRRCFHVSAKRAEISTLAMPAMSPTMTEGGISQWKVQEGHAFSAGDVLLEVETDKATIDVEAQDDGVLGKIIIPNGSKSIPVGKTIALLAEEGDDISNLEVPKEDSPKTSKKEAAAEEKALEPSSSSSSSQPSPKHDVHISSSRPLFPSVQRLLAENGIDDADTIKGTGIRGMLTKGDVLAHLGKVSSPLGSYKSPKSIFPDTLASPKETQDRKPMDGPAIRQLIVASLLQASARARTTPPPATPYDFNSVLADYLPSTSAHSPPPLTFPPKPVSTSKDVLDELL